MTSLGPAERLMILQAMAKARTGELASMLSKRREIASVTKLCDVYFFPGSNRTTFGACVDIETNRGAGLSLWFEFGFENKRWNVEAVIGQNFREGQHTLEEYPESFPTSLEELESEATKAINWLVERGSVFDFEGLKPS